MEDFEILDLMEDLEGVGQGRQTAFKIDGTEVPRKERVAYVAVPKNKTVFYSTRTTGTGTYPQPNDSSYYDQTYVDWEIQDQNYSVDFTNLFEEEFRDRINSLGEGYFYLNTGRNEFTIWGFERGLIRLRKEILEKFPRVSIVELE
jgi:hypothetical protein